MANQNNKKQNNTFNAKTDIDGGQLGGHLNNDNAFSDAGLENLEKLEEATQKANK
jgi:hypothetical protein